MLETSNLAHRLATGGHNKKGKIRTKWVMKGSRDLLSKFCSPLYILRTVEARNFKFGLQIGHWAPNEKMQNWVKMGREGVT